MDWETVFYFFGVFFFISWFIFLTAAVIAVIVMMKRLAKLQIEMEERVQTVQAKIEAKLNQPSTTFMMTLLPLIPTIVSTVHQLVRKKH
jgi:uncharacterized metal-binding protein